MPNHRFPCGHCLVLASLVLPGFGQASARENSSYQRTVERVLTLLPKRPIRVVIINPDLAGVDVGSGLRQIDAFVTKGGREVYLEHPIAVIGERGG